MCAYGWHVYVPVCVCEYRWIDVIHQSLESFICSSTRVKQILKRKLILIRIFFKWKVLTRIQERVDLFVIWVNSVTPSVLWVLCCVVLCSH